jgi:hypothetical protein
MTPHHKPKNVTLTKIGRLVRGNMSHIQYVRETVSHAGEHRSFDVAARALDRIRGAL